MNVIVTGATGLAGSEVVRQGILDPRVDRLTVLSRRPIGVTHPKVDVILHDDFTSYEAVLPKLAGHSAVLWCLGIAQSKVSKAEYERITFDCAISAAQAMAKLDPRTTFCFLSGGGADSSEKSIVLFSRIKGKTENALLRTLPSTYCFRPGYIRPLEPVEGRTLGERLMGAVAPALRRLSNSLVIDADVLARAMLAVARDGAPKHVLESDEIVSLVADRG